MRITNNLIYKTILNNVNLTSEQMMEAQTSVSTGKRINKFSDDPIGAGNIQIYRQSLRQNDQYLENMRDALSQLDTLDSSLTSIEDMITRAKELALEAANGTFSADERNKIAEEVHELSESLIQEGNKRVGSRYIYAGFNYDQPAFQSDGTYLGTSDDFLVEIEEGQKVVVNISGDELFHGAGGGTDILQVMQDFETALRADDAAGISTAVGDLDDCLSHSLTYHAEIGARVNRVQRAEDNANSNEVNIKNTISDVEDADLEETLSQLTQLQYNYQASLIAASKISESNLFDYL